MATWHDLQSARAQWSDAKPMPDETLQELLDGAKEACWQYVNPPAVGNPNGGEAGTQIIPDDVPVRFRTAQLLHARSVWQLPKGGAEGTAGLDGYTTRLYVLGYDVQKILRPPVYGEAVG